MAQTTKIVDLTKSYLPIDPQAFTQNLSYTAREDDPEKGMPIICFEGYNFLPTSYGYRSYFGVDTDLTLDALPTLCDKLFMIQSKTYENMLVALCSDGVYTARVGSTTWTQILALTDTWTLSGIYSQYTYTVIENTLYIYRQGHSHVLKVLDDLTHSTFIPSFLNMAGQLGIFRANGRLAFWDSEDSVAWSSAFDLADFTPSIENLVGNATFFGVLGRIVTIVPHGEGFIIYATKSVVGVSYSNSATNIWDAMVITSLSGIAHPRAVCIGSTVKEHFVYTTNGIAKVGHFNALSRQYEVEYMLPELYDFLKESRDPVALECHAARYLHFCVIDPAYINGRTMFSDIVIPSLAAPLIEVDASLWTAYEALTYLEPNATFQFLDSMLWQGLDTVIIDRTLATYEVPFYCVTAQFPDIANLAHNRGLLELGSAMYKHYAPAIESITWQDTIAQAHQDNLFFTTTVNLASYTRDVVLSLYENITNTRPAFQYNVSGLNTRYSSTLDSFYPKLYPQNISIPGQDGNSVEDLLYNFMASVLEYEKFCEAQYALMLDKVTQLNSQGPYTRYAYASANGITITSYQDSIKRYFPIGGVNVSAYIKEPALPEDLMVLDISAVVKDYVELSTTICSRILTSIDYVPLIESNCGYDVYIQKMSGGFESSAHYFFPTYPTFEEFLTIFSDTAYCIVEGGTGHLIQPYYDEAEYLSDGYTLSSPMLIRAVNLTTLVKQWVRLFILSKSANGISVTEQTHHTAIVGADNYADYVAQGYAYLAPLGGAIGGGPDVPAQGAAFIEKMWHYTIFQGGYSSVYMPIAGAIQYEINRLLPTEIEVLPNKDIICKAHIRQFGTSDGYVLETLMVFRTVKVYRYTLEEDLVFALVPYSANDITYNTEDGGHYQPETVFKFSAYQLGVDTVTVDALGFKTAVNKVTYFTPAVVDPGPSLPLAIPIYPPYAKYQVGLPIADMDCIPWQLYNLNTAFPYTQIKGQHFMLHGAGLMLDKEMPLGPIYALEDTSNACYVDMNFTGWVEAQIDFTYPGATYQIQDGVPVPGYPIYTGTLVFDLHLKKWGKQANVYRALVEYAPMNSTDNAIIPYTNFGMDSGILKPNGKLALFSQMPANSMMRYGKFGLYRLGFTEAFEFTVHFRTPSSGILTVDGSIDNRDLDPAIQHVESFTNVRSHTVLCDIHARWHTLTISGRFDLQSMEFRGIIASRR